MAKNKKIIEIILKERVNRNSRCDWSWQSHYQKIIRADKLLEEIEDKIKSRHCKQEARKQFVTSYITAFEVYFKDILVDVLKVFGNTKITDEIKIKFGVEELKKIIKEKISIDEVITSYFNFQDLSQIEKVFSTMLDVSFFKELSDREFSTSERLPPFKIHKNFYQELESFINLRHDFVHDINFNKNITRAQLNKYVYIYSFFILGVDIFIGEKMADKKKK